LKQKFFAITRIASIFRCLQEARCKPLHRLIWNPGSFLSPIYHNQVLPLKQQQKQIKEILNQKQIIKNFSNKEQIKNFNVVGEKQKGMRPTGHNTGLYEGDVGIRPTGHSTNFNNLSHYY